MQQVQTTSYLQRTFMMTESSSTEFCSLGLEPSHLRTVPSSSELGWKLNTDVTIELLLTVLI